MPTAFRLTVAIPFFLAACIGCASAQATLTAFKDRGSLLCGSSQGPRGFSMPDENGRQAGFDVDVCRALAAAIFNDPDRVRIVPLSAADRLRALQSGDIDVLSRSTTWTMSRDVGKGLHFPAVNFYDGQGFMVRQSKGARSARDLKGASVCVTQASSNELNLPDYSRANGLEYAILPLRTGDELKTAYEAGRCDTFSADLSQLSSIRLGLENPADHHLLPEVISKEPLGPWVRHGDDQWFDVVRWTIIAMINAEELGVTQANINDMLGTGSPEVCRLLGLEGTFGEALGLSRDLVVRIVQAVGNYGESFERHLGAKSPMNLPREKNEIWTRGGLQYAPPARQENSGRV